MPERAVLLQNICEASSPVVWVAEPGSRHEEPAVSWAAVKAGAQRAAVVKEAECTRAAVAEMAEDCSLVVPAAVTECLRGAAAGCSAADQSPACHRVRGCR